MTKHSRQAVYKFICDHIRVAGYAPTVMEIMAGCGIPSKSNVKRILDTLKAEGKIDYQSAQARTITVTGSVWLMPGDRAADIIARLERLVADLAQQVSARIGAEQANKIMRQALEDIINFPGDMDLMPLIDTVQDMARKALDSSDMEATQ